MGEAKRRREMEGSPLPEHEILKRIRTLSTSPPALPGLECVQVLVLKLTHLTEARTALGGLPQACRRVLRELEKLPAGEVDGLWWELWPSGRQVVVPFASLDSPSKELTRIHQSAAVRGHGLQVLAFPADDWHQLTDAVVTEQAPELRKVVEALGSVPAIRRAAPLRSITLLYVPELRDEVTTLAVHAQLLRILDHLASTRNSLLAHRGCVHLGFDGYDDDPREVWTFEPVRQTLLLLNAHAPWWPLLVAAEQFIVWIGAMAPNSLTSVVTERGEGFSIGESTMARVAQEFTGRCVQALVAAGMEPEKEPVASFLQEHFSHFGRTTRLMDEHEMHKA